MFYAKIVPIKKDIYANKISTIIVKIDRIENVPNVVVLRIKYMGVMRCLVVRCKKNVRKGS